MNKKIRNLVFEFLREYNFLSAQKINSKFEFNVEKFNIYEKKQNKLVNKFIKQIINIKGGKK